MDGCSYRGILSDEEYLALLVVLFEWRHLIGSPSSCSSQRGGFEESFSGLFGVAFCFTTHKIGMLSK